MTAGRAGSCIALLAAMAVACSSQRDAAVVADSAEARRLDGMWAIELRVDRLGFAPVAPRAASSRAARGVIALVANHWLDGGDDLPHATHYGTYDIDFNRLGFDPRHAGELPRAAARIGERDSVEVVLEPDDAHESVHLHGGWRADSIVGRWSLEPVRSGGDAAGTFTMVRRIEN